MQLLSEETLAHYGIPGMKKGERRWQYKDGRFNPEGKERYFGKKSSSKNEEVEKQKEQKLLSKMDKYQKKVEKHQYKESKIKGNLFLRNAPVFEIITSYHNWRTHANYRKYIKNKNKYEKLTKKGGGIINKLLNT